MARAVKNRTQSGPDLKAFFDFINEISTEKGLSRDEVLEVMKSALLTAYQKKHGIDANLQVILDKDKPEVSVIYTRSVVEAVENPALEISTEEAKKINPEVIVGGTVEVVYLPDDFSRIGATNVRQIFLQRLKELEREIIFNEFKGKEGDLISGYFQRWRDREVMYVDLGRIEGILPKREQIPTDKFRPGDRIRAVLKSVELKREKSKEPGPFLILSRASGDFVRKLFELEIPEIYDGVVEVLGISREAGYKTKIMVRSKRSDVDPVGACVGVRGVRIQAVVRELGNERIDIVPYSEDPGQLIASALAPGRVVDVKVDNTLKEALVVVPDDSYSATIGQGGKNVRLASHLTGFKLAVKSQSQFSDEMSSPEARARLEALFAPAPEPEEIDYTPVTDLPGISTRVAELLRASSIKSVEELVETPAEKLVEILGKNTAKQVQTILQEVVEVEEE